MAAVTSRLCTIKRERATYDERTVWIHLTDQGSALQQRVVDLPERLECAVDLTTDEFHQLHQLLSRVRASATTNQI